MNSYLLYEPNSALRAFTITPELSFLIFDPRGKIVQNIKFSSVGQNSDLISKLDPTHQHESRGCSVSKTRPKISSFWKFTQIKTIGAYLEKCYFQRKLIFQIWDWHWIRGAETSLGVVSDPDFKSQLVMHAKWGKFKLIFFYN